MKTFSAMCIGDLYLTADAYDHLITKLKNEKYSIPQDHSYMAKFNQIAKQIDRLIQLRTAVQNEIDDGRNFTIHPK